MSIVPILLYHSIGETGSAKYRRWVVSPDRFRQHMKLLVENSYHPITVRELSLAISEKRQLPHKAAVVTFDDGLRDFLTGAMPVLSHYDIPATLFVAAGYIARTSWWLSDLGEGSRPMLDWNELRSIADAGIEIGGHSCTHPQLDILPSDYAFEEISASKRILEDGLFQTIHSFAYPHGYASRTTRRLVRKAGYSSACRVRNAFCSIEEDIFGLSRIVVTDDVDERQLLRILQGKGFSVAPAADRMSTRVWRVARWLIDSQHYKDHQTVLGRALQ